MLIAISRISGLGTVFLAGWTADKLGARQTLIAVFLLSGLATVFLGVADNLWLVIVVILQSLLASCFFPAGFAALIASAATYLYGIYGHHGHALGSMAFVLTIVSLIVFWLIPAHELSFIRKRWSEK